MTKSQRRPGRAAAPSAPATATDAPGRQKLLRAGMKLFADRGFAATGLREIAEEAKVALNLIRVHFGSKDGLREAIDDFVLSEIGQLYSAVLSHSGAEALERVVEDAVDWIERDRDALMYARMALMEKTPGSQRLFDALLQIMRKFVELNEKRGFLQDGVDREWAAIYMVFDFIGPAIIEPFAKTTFGKSMYSRSMIKSRNAFMRRLFTRGYLKG